MLEIFKRNEHLDYFYLYAAVYLVFGAHISALGPYIPYLTAETGIV